MNQFQVAKILYGNTKNAAMDIGCNILDILTSPLNI
jgi:hypothetical protein